VIHLCTADPALCRYDPDSGIVDDIDTPQERVQFLQDVAQAMFVKARIKLNIKRLYAADGTAVRELLKLANLLYKASMQAEADPEVLLLYSCKDIPPDSCTTL
jgi:Clusterin-associated protein-1